MPKQNQTLAQASAGVRTGGIVYNARDGQKRTLGLGRTVASRKGHNGDDVMDVARLGGAVCAAPSAAHEKCRNGHVQKRIQKNGAKHPETTLH